MSSAIRRAERRRVPLKAMCSMRCERPCSSSRSLREPAPTHTPSVAVLICGMRSVTTVRPFGERVISIDVVLARRNAGSCGDARARPERARG